MVDLIEAAVPMGSTLLGMVSGLKSAHSQMQIEQQERREARQQEKDLESLRLAHEKDIEQNEINIQPTYTDRFFGVVLAGKDFGIKITNRSESLLMSPVNTAKFIIAGLFAYTYCVIWQFNAFNAETAVRTILPEPNTETWDLLGIKFETVTHIIDTLTLGGLAATTMAQPPLMLVSYVVTNLTYKQIAQR